MYYDSSCCFLTLSQIFSKQLAKVAEHEPNCQDSANKNHVLNTFELHPPPTTEPSGTSNLLLPDLPVPPPTAVSLLSSSSHNTSPQIYSIDQSPVKTHNASLQPTSKEAEKKESSMKPKLKRTTELHRNIAAVVRQLSLYMKQSSAKNGVTPINTSISSTYQMTKFNNIKDTNCGASSTIDNVICHTNAKKCCEPNVGEHAVYNNSNCSHPYTVMSSVSKQIPDSAAKMYLPKADGCQQISKPSDAYVYENYRYKMVNALELGHLYLTS